MSESSSAGVGRCGDHGSSRGVACDDESSGSGRPPHRPPDRPEVRPTITDVSSYRYDMRSLAYMDEGAVVFVDPATTVTATDRLYVSVEHGRPEVARGTVAPVHYSAGLVAGVASSRRWASMLSPSWYPEACRANSSAYRPPWAMRSSWRPASMSRPWSST